MSEKKQDREHQIANMTEMEIVELIDAMKERFGVSAAAAVATSPVKATPKAGNEVKKQHLQRLVGLLNDLITRKRVSLIRETYLDLMSADTLGIEISTFPTARIVPVVIYLGGGEYPERVLSALNEFSRGLGLEVFDLDEPVVSSFWQKLWLKTTSKETKEELKEALNKGKEALEAKNIDKPQSETDLNRANAAAALLSALGADSKSTAILYGGILILSLKDENGDRHNRVISLTKKQIQYIQQNLEILKEPEKLLAHIDNRLRAYPSRGDEPTSHANSSAYWDTLFSLTGSD